MTHLVKLLKCQNGVNAGAGIFVLLCNAWAYKHDLCLGYAALYIHCVRHHGRHGGGKELAKLREVLFHKQIHRVADRGYDDILCALSYLPLILTLDYRCTDGGLLGVGKAESFQGLAHGIYAAIIPNGEERRRNACDNGRTAVDERTHRASVVDYLLCLLRTYDKALAAEDALVAYDMCLMTGKADGLNGAFSYTSVTVFAV